MWPNATVQTYVYPEGIHRIRINSRHRRYGANGLKNDHQANQKLVRSILKDPQALGDLLIENEIFVGIISAFRRDEGGDRFHRPQN